ncbi:MAG TPA: DUF5946 family protein [Candidatus Acidoferrum sp.]|nr:DUF5946 family protein [Candidatus Acidoferrum sp.]
MDPARSAYEEVYVYTMGRPGFILQHVADAFTVQTATPKIKPIALVFGLAGLYLHLEKNFSGRQVQKMHMKMARFKRVWPTLPLPEDRGGFSVLDVLAAVPGPARDRAIDVWCRSVWSAFAGARPAIVSLLREYDIR